MVVVRFKTAPPPQEDDGKAVFARAKRRHYERLLARDLPGTPWFGYQAREADTLVAADPRPAGLPAQEASDQPGTDLRPLQRRPRRGRESSARPGDARGRSGWGRGGESVKTQGLKGITVAEMDWSARLKGRAPASIPWQRAFPPTSTRCSLPD